MPLGRGSAPAIRAGSFALSTVLLLGASFAFGAPGLAAPAHVAAAERHDSSPPLWLLPRGRGAAPTEWEHEMVRVPRPAALTVAPQADPVRQAWRSYVRMPAPVTSFEGVGDGFSATNGTFQVDSMPPDTNGDAGPNHFFQVVNSEFAIFNKAGTPVYGPTATYLLWSGFGGVCETTNEGDGIVLYDALADRWFVSQFAFNLDVAGNPVPPYYQCVAVSQTGDPTGAYHRYAFKTDNFPDYGKFGVWPDGYYSTFNTFGTTAYAGALVCAYERGRMLSGLPATQQCFQLGTDIGGLLAADIDGTRLPPQGSPNYVMGFDINPSVLQLWRAHVDWLDPTKSNLTRLTDLPVAAINVPCPDASSGCVPQPGVRDQLDPIGDRLMYRLAYRNFGDHEALVLNHTVATGTSGSAPMGVRWYEVRDPGGTPTVFQQGTYAPDSTSRWMGSIAQDGNGNIALGFSASSGTVKPSIRYTGRLATDPAGQMTQGEGELYTGAASQTASGLTVTAYRWGDYSSLAVDPADDCTFWYTTEYIPTNGMFNWHSRVGSFKFSGCPGVTNDFSVAVAPRERAIKKGQSASYTVTTAVGAGAAESLTLAAVGLSPGVTASFSPVTVMAGGTSTLTLTASGTATPVDLGPFNVIATSPSATRTAVGNLTVERNDFSLALTPDSLAVLGGSSGTFTLTTAQVTGDPETISFQASGLPLGVSVSFKPTSVLPGESTTVTVTVDAASAGARNQPFTLSGKSVSVSHSVTALLSVPNDFSLTLSPLSAGLAANGTRNFTVTTAKTSGNAETIILGVQDLPEGVTFTLRPSPMNTGDTATLTLSGDASLMPHDPVPFKVTASSSSAEHSVTGSLKTLSAPLVLFAPPSDRVSGTVMLSATATVSSNTAVAKLQLLVDDVELASSPAGSLAAQWDTTKLSNGIHTLIARVVDADDDTAEQSVPVEVHNVAPPEVAITSPTAGQEVKGKVTFTANATAHDGTTLSKTEFYVDDALVGTSTEASPSVAVDTHTLKNGAHALTAKAYDSEDHATVSEAVSFKVNNGLCGCSADGSGASGTAGLLMLLFALRRRAVRAKA